MAVTLLPPERIGPTTIRIRFSSDLGDPTFYVWVDGALFAETAASYVDVPLGLGRQARVEVFDDAEARPGPHFPAAVTLRWRRAAFTALYRVEQWVEGAWVIREQVPSAGRGIFRWESAPLADGEVHRFRVVPVDGTGRDGVARKFSGVMCRYPDAPVLSASLSGGEFTVTDV